MKKTEILELKTYLKTRKSIVIVPHRNPDGDAIGACLALYIYLKKQGHYASVIAPNDYPNFLKWLPQEATILKFEEDSKTPIKLLKEADLIFTLDFNALHRTGEIMEQALRDTNALKVMIDHHQQPEDYAAYMYSDVSMSSTCEMVYNFISFFDDADSIDKDIATCIYTGIMTDTGSFRFSSTSSKTHRVVANLIEKGANNASIHNHVFDTNSYGRLQLLRAGTSKFESNSRICIRPI